METTDCSDCCGSGRLSAADPRSADRPCPQCDATGQVPVPVDRYPEEVEHAPLSPLGRELFGIALAMSMVRRRAG